MKMIKVLAGALGMAVSVSSMAVGFDSVSNPLSGDMVGPASGATAGMQPVERHWAQSYTIPGTCGAVCQGAELQESEVLIELNVINQTGCNPAGGPGTSGTRQCTQAPAVADYYTGNSAGGGSNYTGSGLPAAQVGATPTISHLQIFAPFCSTPGAGCFSYIDLGNAGAALFNMLDWDFNTNIAGKITDGHAMGSANVASNNIVGMFNFSTLTFTTHYGPDAEAQSKIDCLVDTPTACASATFLLSRSFAFEYVTAGSEQLELNKAVPVPAFAAAVLGLGLLAVTVLTGRRRQIK